MVVNNVIALAKTAKAFNVPTILTTVLEARALAMPAIQAAGEGYEVYAVTDASGGVTAEAHDMAVRRMAQAGVVPITWMAVGGELQRDWAREASAQAFAEILAAHGGGSGVAYTWEMQLLAQALAPNLTC
jgi:nicotinamidase-related amidase